MKCPSGILEILILQTNPSKKCVMHFTFSLHQTNGLHLLKSPLFQQQHQAHLCTGVWGWIEVNTPPESSTQYLLPWSNKQGSARGLAGWMNGGGEWSWESWKMSWHKCQWALSGEWFMFGGVGGVCPNSWSTWLAVSSTETWACSFSEPHLLVGLFIFLARCAEGREQAGLEWEWRWFT